MAKICSLCFVVAILISCKWQSNSVGKSNQLVYQELFSNQSSQDIACYRIPTVIATVDGNLVAAVDERVPNCGDLRSNRDINIVIRRSSDFGNSWFDIERIVDYPLGVSASDPSMIYDKVNGTLFLFYNYMDLNRFAGEYFFKVMRSNDEGKSWSDPVDITSQISKDDWAKDFKFITSGRGTQTKVGKLLHTLVNLDHGLHVFESNDFGQNWGLIDQAISPGDESKIIELSDGSWMINSRVNKSGLRYVHLSKDEGSSWHSKPDSNLIDPSCNASILEYTNNQLLFCNANDPNSRTNLSLRISKDDGQTWSIGKTIYAGGSAYSSICNLDKEAIGVLFEKDDYKEIVFVRLEADWFN